jgi:hypothetical protein
MPAPDTSALDAIFDASRDARVNRVLDSLPAVWRDDHDRHEQRPGHAPLLAV